MNNTPNLIVILLFVVVQYCVKTLVVGVWHRPTIHDELLMLGGRKYMIVP